MAVLSHAVTVTTTATRLDSTTDSDDGISGSSLLAYNVSAAIVYVGGSGVTTATGTPVPAASWGPSLDLNPGDAVYGIVAAGTAEVRVLEVGVG